MRIPDTVDPIDSSTAGKLRNWKPPRFPMDDRFPLDWRHPLETPSQQGDDIVNSIMTLATAASSTAQPPDVPFNPPGVFMAQEGTKSNPVILILGILVAIAMIFFAMKKGKSKSDEE